MTTPIRKQYLRIKKQYPDALLLFRLGDFYETFDEDARVLAKELDIALTSREMGKGQRIPLAGIPHHALEGYLGRLLKRGHKVAICEQLEEAAASKGLIARDVVRVVTPGTVVEPTILEQGANNYLAAVVVEGEEAGVSHVDITTGEFATTQLPVTELANELERLHPSELVVPEGMVGLALPQGSTLTHLKDESGMSLDAARRRLLEQFHVLDLQAFGCESQPLAVQAAAIIVMYLSKTQNSVLSQLSHLSTYSTGAFMVLDSQTRRNLGLVESAHGSGQGASLLAVLDFTKTPMGARLLRRWVGQPLLDLAPLLQRQEAIAWFHRSTLRRKQTMNVLGQAADMERLIRRIQGERATPREVLSLGRSLEALPGLKALLEDADDSDAVAWLAQDIAPAPDVVALIERSIEQDPGEPGEGDAVREGFSPELDQVRMASRSAREYIAGLEKKERERTGIKSLKVGYNRVFGYYIEVTNPHLSLTPADYIRRQTLVNGERFYTPELKEYEATILNAKEQLEELELAIFRQVCRQIALQAASIERTAQAVAQVDVFASLAEAASRYGYVRPHLDAGEVIDIRSGRHPLVERALPSGAFVPNDVYLANADAQLGIITGPNMSGKSTYIRQVALIVLMAQIGSFVPAQSAVIGLVDRIFTRVGLQDDLVSGRSTFMVEMLETASILNIATRRSLVVLDEIGRGTSTYDGLSIALAVAEHIHNSPRLGCKALFATHYHEMTELARYLPRVRNFNVTVSEEDGKVVFLHRIVPGGANKSYGIHVAQLAGLPRAVISRAWEVLRGLEGDSRKGPGATRPLRKKGSENAQQLPFAGLPSPVMEELKALDVTSMTPLEAINKLFELQQQARKADQLP